MKRFVSSSLTLLMLLLACHSARAQEPKYYGIPLKPDPPPAIDGRLDEWSKVPNAWVLNSQPQVVYGGNQWRGPADLSAKVWIAWRQEYLYFAADVTDDHIVQTGQGVDMWKGDHIEFYLDAAPDLEPERAHFGQGQVQFGFSPGNFQKTGDPLVDRAPEAVVFNPEGGSAAGILVAAQRTATGYALEAAIPWTLIGKLANRTIGTPTAGMPLGVEVGISDTDGNEPKQEKMMTLLTSAWAPQNRSRLVTAALAPADGIPPPVVRSVKVFDTLELPRGERQEVRFNAPAVPQGKDAILTLRARLDNPTVAGYNSAMKLSLNGVALDDKRLQNRPLMEEMVSGQTQPAVGGGQFTVPYAPDYAAADNHPAYGYRHSKASQFELRVTDLLKPGENVLVIENHPVANLDFKLVAGEGRLELRAPFVAPVKRKAPTGPLPVMLPAASYRVHYTLSSNPDGTMTLQIGPTTFQVASQFSTPDGAWQKGSNKYFSFKRNVQRGAGAIVVQDTFTNLTDANLPLMQQHRITLSPGSDQHFKQVWLAGLSPSSLTSSASDPGNPTTYGATSDAGVGVMAWDDVSQVHVANFSNDTTIGLADNQFVLKPHATHTAEWAILPTATPDYYSFLNAARRLRDCNFAIDGSFCFLRADPREVTDKWSDKQFASFIRYKNAKFVCDLYTYPAYKGLFPHGTAFQTLDWTYLKKQIARLREAVPEAKHLTYFHCFIDVLDDADKKYPDARLLRSDGKQADYGDAADKIFVPTATNSFGHDVAENVGLILNPQPVGFGCDGVYWDEFEYSAVQYHYDDFSRPDTGLPWDGVSADIDPQTKQITRLKSSTTLLSQPFRIALARRIMAQGPLIGNGQPFTRSMIHLHFPRFVETGSISNCSTAQIFSPIALGDSLTERSEVDAYHNMLRALNYGCVYYWYNDLTVIPTYPTLTSYMFPITPLELHEGYIIGQERIITNRSGLFGWGDNSRQEAHVFNDEGREVRDFKAPLVVKDGMTLTELRLPEDWSAAIIRKP